jgi:SulP family sulfate permease
VTETICVAHNRLAAICRRDQPALHWRQGTGPRHLLRQDLQRFSSSAIAIVIATTAVWGFDLASRSAKIVGTVPQRLPRLAMPPADVTLWTKLLVPALLISIVR